MSTVDTPADGRLRLDREDLAAMPADGRRYELIDGEIVVSPSPVTRHQLASKRLQYALETYVRRTRVGLVYNAPTDVVLSTHDVVVPDLLVVLRGGLGVVTKTCVEGPPDLVIEILSPSTARRDRRDKRTLYGKFGVREYWVVDTDADWVERFELVDGRMELSERVEAPEDTLRTPLLPDFELPLTELFAAEER